METKNGVIETERLILRRYVQTDLQDLYEYLSDEEVVKYEPYKPMNMEKAKEELEWRCSSEEMIAVELKENKKLIGGMDMRRKAAML